jgi:uncharacterized membrane protein
MDLRLVYAIILSVLPVSELRGGLPLAILYANTHEIPIFLVSSLVILLNILVVFFVFYFLDNINALLLKNRLYKRFFEKIIQRFQKKANKFEGKYKDVGFLALMFFVAVPLPGTGAWTGCLISWLLGLERKKSVLFISLGVILAGIIVLLGTLGLIRIFS